MTRLARHLESTVTVESVGPVDISTIDLSQHGRPGLVGLETCLFWGRESVVVASYPTWDAAVQGHSEWNSAEKVARALHVLYRGRINR
jgi:hypothetical protein